jgi:hypothetical protein
MRRAVLAFLEHDNIPRFNFHETLTRSWILAVRHFMCRTSSVSASDFIAKVSWKFRAFRACEGR